MKRIGLASLLSLSLYSHADPLPVGNFALPISQQISPLVSFGENVINKGQTIFYLFADSFVGDDLYLNEVIPSLLYGITDNLSIYLQVPVSPGNKQSGQHSSGFEDLSFQFEYAIYVASTQDSLVQATIVTNVAVPTGSATKNPPTGFGAPSFFLGSTLSYTTPKWFMFTSPGVVLPTRKHGTQFGDQILYQFGLARNIPSPKDWIFAVMTELDGQYSFRNTVHGKTVLNSGGNVVYLTPSLWFSSNRVILQAGVGYPMIQHLFGHQPKQWISFDFNFGLTF